ncbi:PAS domain S-box protein [Natrinema thermotolerans]|uniref:PAS domain S-box protein n=1 Tax=Natrinema thermotolerans TaxID=121872 RepID=A0AAF0T678_9EURY|nr:PAS domain S-box protein [Natrinema thermotolerans]QCC60609.1 PAS domain S-box protein [Natrinema thermotolerans]QCC61495.1 PAS domain S-box protein [Natrinema thermotolerans]WMT07652.1 PAS domain S-box protein [Natrinema thermotolerans]WMT08284.1 PAS domain S-box protein [Natrinema thermotolerans]
MTRGFTATEPTPVRALVVGSSEWARSTAEFADERLTVTGPVTGVDDLADDRLEAADCVLTDDPTVVDELAGSCPVVYALDPTGDESIDDVRRGATDVIAATTARNPALLAHRLERAVATDARAATADGPPVRGPEWYRIILEYSSEVVLTIEADGEISYASPAVEVAGGYDPTALRGDHYLDHVHEDDTAAVAAEFEAVREADLGTSRSVEYTCQHADGAWYVHEAVLTNRLGDGVVDGVVASIRDITEYHRIERELSESFKRVTDAFYALDSDWEFTYVNDRALEILSTDRSELLGRHILEVFPEMTGTAFQSAATEAMAEQESRTVEGYLDAYDAWIEARIYPSPSGMSVYWRDVTDRVQRKRDLTERTERLQTLVENAPIVLFVLDEDGTFTLSEGRGLANLGTDAGEVVGDSFFDQLGDYPDICDDARRALEGADVHSRRELSDRVFEMWYRPITNGGDVDRVIGVASDITERVQYQEALNGLHEASSHLLSVDSKAAACESIVEVATDVLDLDSVVYRFDERANELRPAAHASAFESTFGSPPRIEPDGSIVWETFVNGETAIYDDTRDSTAVSDEETAARSVLSVPLGEHGVVVALSTDPAAYDDETVELAELFARAAEAALDRIGRTRRLRDRERELEAQNRHLERLNDANEIRQGIEELLLKADSRAEIERGVPRRLAALESCSLAWFGEPDPGGNHLQVRASEGADRGYLEAVTATTVDDSAAEPAGRAARTQAPVYVENVADAVHDGEWRRKALSRNFQSVYAVPLVYDGFCYGVVSIYGEERDAVDETLRSMLSELGETIAYAIDAVKRKNALFGDDRTEVELAVAADTTLCQLAARLGSPVRYEGATAPDEGPQLVFAAIEGPIDDPASAVDLAAVDGISEITTIADHEGETLVQLRMTDSFLGSIAGTHGARLREFSVDESGGRAVVDVPDAVEIRELLADITRSGPSVSMVARREAPTDDPETVGGATRTVLLESFTDRQREVVQTAYHGGFFEWPRRATGEEIADSLDISSPAFHKHVRSAERKLFAALFDGTTTEEVN